MLKKLLIFVFISILIGSSFSLNRVSAVTHFHAELFPYKSIQVQVMPEFDYPENWPEEQPTLLVGYFGTFVNKSGSEYNQEITFPLPTYEPNFQVYLAAEFPEENKPEVPVKYTINKEKKEIIWKPTKPIAKDATYKFVIEYYANPINVKENKAFEYHFSPTTNIEQLDIVFYAPINAKDFVLVPKSTDVSKSEYGEEIHHYQYLNANKGTIVSFKASYEKKDNTSSMSIISTKNPPQDENHQGVSGTTAKEQVLNNSKNSNDTTSRPIINTTGALIIGISMVIMGAFIYQGFKGKASLMPKYSVQQIKSKNLKNTRKIDKKSEEIKTLRKMLLSGEIDQRTYAEKVKKLN